MTEQHDLEQQEPEQKAATQSNVPEYGRLLTEARESKGLSVEQVASQLRLSAKQIIGLESGDPSAFASVVYTRAHLRSYARLLGLDEAKIIDLFSNSLASEDRDQKALIRKTTTGLRPYQEETTKNGKGKGIGWIIFLVVVAIVAYMGWRYMNPSFNLQEVKSSLNFMNSSDKPAVEASAGTSKAAEGEKALTTNTDTKKAEEQKPAAAEESKPAPKQETSAKAETAAAAAAADGVTAAPSQTPDGKPITQVGKTPEERALEEKVMAEHNQQLEAQKKAEEAKKAPAASEPAAPVTLKLVQNENGWSTTLPSASSSQSVNIKFSATDGDCWFGIYVNGKLVDNTTLKQGETKEFKHPLPFRVTVGNKFRAKVSLNSNPVDLASSSRSGSVSFQVFTAK